MTTDATKIYEKQRMEYFHEIEGEGVGSAVHHFKHYTMRTLITYDNKGSRVIPLVLELRSLGNATSERGE